VTPELFVAIELTETGQVNDSGTMWSSREAAWKEVQSVFDPKTTQIFKVIPDSKVYVPVEVSFIPIRNN